MKDTISRGYNFPDHRPPADGVVDADGHHWHGTSRVLDRGARRRANRRSWAAQLADARRAYVASKAVAK